MAKSASVSAMFLALLPGLLVQSVAMHVYSVAPWRFAFMATTLSLGFALQYLVGKYRAQRSQQEIDALDSLAAGT